MKQNKSATLESVQYGLEIIFNINSDFNAGVCMTYKFEAIPDWLILMWL